MVGSSLSAFAVLGFNMINIIGLNGDAGETSLDNQYRYKPQSDRTARCCIMSSGNLVIKYRFCMFKTSKYEYAIKENHNAPYYMDHDTVINLGFKAYLVNLCLIDLRQSQVINICAQLFY